MTTRDSCPFCVFFAPSKQLLHKHVISVHSLDSNFQIQCNCHRTFTNYRTYQNHRLRCACTSINDPRSEEAVDDNNERYNENFDSEEQQIIDEDHSESGDEFNMTEYAAKWILKTSESRSLTRTAMVGIIDDVTELVSMITNNIFEDVKCLINAEDINISQLENLRTQYSNPFSGVSTFYQQLQYYKLNFGLIVSIINYCSGRY